MLIKMLNLKLEMSTLKVNIFFNFKVDIIAMSNLKVEMSNLEVEISNLKLEMSKLQVEMSNLKVEI